MVMRALPIGVLPSRKVNEPVPEAGTTFAVKVTGVATSADVVDAMIVEVVGFRMTCAVTELEVAAVSSVSPL